MTDLYLNSKNAWTAYGVQMGDSFIDTLLQPPTLKDFPSSKCRLENGTRYVTSSKKKEERTITLQFAIHGNNPFDFKTKRRRFYNLLAEADIAVYVPQASTETFRLIYKGSSVSYAGTAKSCKISAKFIEPDPSDRATTLTNPMQAEIPADLRKELDDTQLKMSGGQMLTP